MRIQFEWYDSFNNKKDSKLTFYILSVRHSSLQLYKKGQYDLTLEKCAILFNIGTIYASQAAKQNLSNDDGLKNANNLFKSAAGAFETLKKTLEGSTHPAYTPDLSIGCADFLVKLMLGQAQECFFYKSLKANMKPKNVSMLAVATAEYYASCVEVGKSMKGVIPSKWLTQLAIKKDLLTCLACLHVSKDDVERDEQGVAVSRLRTAKELLNSHKKDIKQANNDFQEQYAKSLKEVEQQLGTLEKENDTIYYKQVPPFSSLPPLPKKSMVSPLELPSEFVKLSTSNDPFVKLVPFAIHESLSKYNELKKEFVANEFRLFEQANETLKAELQKMALPGSLEALEKTEGGLPPSLLEKVRVIQQEGGEKHLIELLSAKANLSNYNAQLVGDALNLLDQEEAEDNEMRNQFGNNWNRTPSHALTSFHRQEAAKFQANLQHALKSDALVENKFKTIQLELRKLGGNMQEVLSLLPQAASPQTNQINSTFVPELQKCLKAVDSIISSRLQLQQNLKTMADNDNITNTLLESLKPPENIFQEELKKYEQIQEQARDNIEKQRLQLEVTKKLNDAWNNTKSSDPTGKVREQALNRLDQVYQMYLQLKANLKEGIEFYTNIQEVILKFKRKCEDLVFARQTEKQELLIHLNSSSNSSNSSFQPTAPNFSLYSNNPTTSNQQRPLQDDYQKFGDDNQFQQQQAPPSYQQSQQTRYSPLSNNNQPQQTFNSNNQLPQRPLQPFNPNNQFNSNQQQFNPNKQQFNPNQQQFNPNQQQFNPNQQQRNQYNPSPQQRNQPQLPTNNNQPNPYGFGHQQPQGRNNF